MKCESDLCQLREFYENLDAALTTFSSYRRNFETLPIIVGGDSPYFQIEERLGQQGLNGMLKECGKYFKAIEENKPGKCTSCSRFDGECSPVFSDADLYLDSPENYLWVSQALQSMGYFLPNKNGVEQKGYAVFLNKKANPVKVDVMVKTKNGNSRPQSQKPIETVMPLVGKAHNCITRLGNIQNIKFLKPECVKERLISDIKTVRTADGKIPSKMFEDLFAIHRFLRLEKNGRFD